MLDLKKTSGLGLELKDGLELACPENISADSPTSKTIDDLKPFLNEGASAAKPLIYKVWRNMGLRENANAVKATGLRYDITALNPGAISHTDGTSEFFRTAGHYHESSPDGINFPEVYEVLAGRGRWLIQRRAGDHTEIIEIYLIEAGPGEKICIPPLFGHITINAEAEPLVVSNIIADKVENDYAPFKSLKGAAFRLLASNVPDMIEIISNGNYRTVPPLRKLKPKKDWYNGYFDPLYQTLVSEPGKLLFLSRPETYKPEFFSIDRLYQEIN